MKQSALEKLEIRKMENGWSITFCLMGKKSKEVYVQTWAAVHDFVSRLLSNSR